MAAVETSILVRALSLGAKPVTERLKRKEAVVGILHQLRLAPERPPADFDGVYTYAIVQFCYGKPEPVVRLFQNEYVRAAFRRTFESGDESHLRREVDEILQWNEETGGLGRIDYNLALEVTGFRAVFDELVDKTRTAAGARLERGVTDIQQTLHDLVERLDRMESPEEIVRYLVRDDSPAAVLAAELREWFAAVEYEIAEEVESGPGEFVWRVRVPARRGYDWVVVLGIGGELSAPDVARAAELVRTHRAGEGWVVAPQRISRAARAADEELPEIYCYTLDELIDERADFEPYLRWLEEEVRSHRIEERYIPLSCAKEDIDRRSGKVGGTSVYGWADGGLDAYVSRWMEDDSKEHLSVLGEFGMGKSWFCLHYAWTLAQEWRAAKAAGRKRPRLPLVVPLRDYAKAVTVESLFSEFFFRKHEILPNGYRVFETLNRLGRLLLIFDGFDEMAARVDRQAMVNNFWELARAVVPGSKVLLTCRSEHFPEAQQGRDVLGARLAASTSALSGEPPQFEVVELQPFDDEQIDLLLSRLTDEPTRAGVLGNGELMDLMRRPVMSELVLDALPAIEQGAKVDISRVYLYAVHRKIEADIKAERTFTSLADKVFFLCELSSHMLTESVMTINYREIPDRIRACFKDVVREQKDLDHWHYDMMGQTMLVRDADGNYTPAHRSLLEFFVAYKIAAELGVMDGDFLALIGSTDPAGPASFPWSGLTAATPAERAAAGGWVAEPLEAVAATLRDAAIDGAVIDLWLPMMVPGTLGDIVAVLQETRRLEPDVLGHTGASLLAIIGAADRRALRGRNLDGVFLDGAVLDHSGTGMDLTGASLRGARLRNADLEDVVLAGADLTGADLTGATYLGFERCAVQHVRTTPAGDVLLVDREDRLYRWTVGEPPALLVERQAIDDEEISTLPDGRLVVSTNQFDDGLGVRCLLVDPRTGGHRVFHLPGGGWATGVLLGDRPVILARSFSDEDTVVEALDPEALTPIAEVRLPGIRYASFSADGSGRVMGLLTTASQTTADSLVELTTAADGTLTLVPVPIDGLEADENGWELFWFRPGGLALVRYGTDEMILSTLDLAAGTQRDIRFPPERVSGRIPDYPFSRRRSCSIDEAASVAAVVVDDRVHVLELAADPMRTRFVVDDLPMVSGFAIVPGTDLLVVASAYGRVGAYDMRTGERVDGFSLSRRVRGAVLADVVGVPPEVLAELERNGAILKSSLGGAAA
ncbi:NACHT domain-containing protein [Pseudosporangium ferrugineum]|uniref:Pentapeptide repeat protein n=1 Tax=Pseudosporangium ferrugineum TaxID=439699 RepID=A0A2T0RWY4_9ACTN|nr:pentapeptide repeat-containing protein [Pseudosporangium ferrugineum]PRY25668.1 pentapeptide repeat protein [Pseudosporangium ferrugineum]